MKHLEILVYLPSDLNHLYIFTKVYHISSLSLFLSPGSSCQDTSPPQRGGSDSRRRKCRAQRAVIVTDRQITGSRSYGDHDDL